MLLLAGCKQQERVSEVDAQKSDSFNAGVYEVIEDSRVPQAGPAAWAFANLCILVVGCAAAAMPLFGKDDAHIAHRLIALLPALGMAATFFCTENLTARMRLIDRWTPLMFLLLLAQVVVLFFMIRIRPCAKSGAAGAIEKPLTKPDQSP